MAGLNNGGTSALCFSDGTSGMERVRFFARQLLTPDDLTQEQQYMRAKLRRHNRLLHGWGVVCGAEVKPAASDWTVTITPGYILTPQGDEVLIDTEQTLDLSQQDLDGNAVGCGEPSDPWCASVHVDRKAGDTVFIAVAYSECMVRPVRVQPAGCGCDGSDCEYSRVRDGYVVRVLTQLPQSYANMGAPNRNPFDCPDDGVRQCPDCPADPWVILASLQLKGKTIAQDDIDNRTLRRYVATFADYWFQCVDAAPPPTTAPTSQPTVQPTFSPSPLPTFLPSPFPTFTPTRPPIVVNPTLGPTRRPPIVVEPTFSPTARPPIIVDPGRIGGPGVAPPQPKDAKPKRRRTRKNG